MKTMLHILTRVIYTSIVLVSTSFASTAHYNPHNIPEAIPLKTGDEIVIPLQVASGHFIVVTLTENRLSAQLKLETADGIILQESKLRDLLLRRKLFITEENCTSCYLKISGWSESGQASVHLNIRQYDSRTDATRYQAEQLSAQGFRAIESEAEDAFEVAVARFSQSLSFWQTTKDFHEIANTYFLLGETRDDPTSGNSLLNDYVILKEIAIAQRDFFIAARAEIALGQQAYRRGKYEDALNHYRAVEQGQFLGQVPADTHLVHFLRGQLDNEITLANMKMRQSGTTDPSRDCTHDFSSTTATKVKATGNSESVFIENSLSRAYDHFASISDAGNMAEVLNNLGFFYRLTERLDLAAAQHSVAYSLSKQSSDNQGMSMRTLYYMGVVSGRRGRYFHALELLKKAELEAVKLKTPIWHAHIKASQARFNLDLGRTSLSKKLFDEASAMYLQADAKADMLTIYLHLGRLYSETGNFEKAESFFIKAKALDTKMTSGDHKRNVLNAQITSLIQQKKYAEALPLQQQLLNTCFSNTPLYFTGRNFSQLAEILFALGRNNESLAYAKQAADLQRNTGDDLYFIKSTHLIAKNLQHLSEPTEIINLYVNEGISKIEDIRQSLTDDGLRREYFGLQKSLYELKIELSLISKPARNDEIINALVIAESYKARTLYELLIQNSSDQEHTGKEINFSHMATDDQLQRAFEIFSQKTINQPAVYEKPFTKHQIESYLKTLPAKEAILYYFSGHNQTFAWLLSAQESVFFRIDEDQPLSSAIADIESGLSTPPSGRGTASSLKQLNINLNKVSALLLGKFREKLDNYDHLRIFPDGAIHRVPFAVLQSSQNLPLISSHSISWGFSLTTDPFLHQPSSNRSGVQSLLVVAPYTNPKKQMSDTAALRHTKVEVDTVAQLWADKKNLTLLTDESATPENIESAISKNFSILHFASHARVDWDYPELTSIKLYPVANSEAPTNLRIHDITNWKISPELVVLSACETAAGRHIVGEGPMGLARAFIDSGARRAIASFWPIDDEATAVLMKHFYLALLDKKLNPPDALRKAQLELSKVPKWSHPFYWSGIGVFGNKDSWLENPAKPD